MPESAPSGQPDKLDDRATLSVAIPPNVLVTLIRTIAWITFLAALVWLVTQGFDPTVLAPFAPRP